jgi:hypothetical protein
MAALQAMRGAKSITRTGDSGRFARIPAFPCRSGFSRDRFSRDACRG